MPQAQATEQDVLSKQSWVNLLSSPKAQAQEKFFLDSEYLSPSTSTHPLFEGRVAKVLI